MSEQEKLQRDGCSHHQFNEVFRRLDAVEKFDRDLKNNLYKLWNRLTSGCYFPPPVLRVEIPKKDGGKRALGIPTVSDRIAQMVVKQFLEPKVEPHFHEDSYGYRPGKSAIDAVGVARKRCWRNDFVLDVDIKNFFVWARKDSSRNFFD